MVLPFKRFKRRRAAARKNNEVPVRNPKRSSGFFASQEGDMEILYQKSPCPSAAEKEELAVRFDVKVKRVVAW